MDLSEFLNGEEMTGKQAGILFFTWLGLVLSAGLILAFVV